MSRRCVALIIVAAGCAPAAFADFTHGILGGFQPAEIILRGDAAYIGSELLITSADDQSGALWYDIKQEELEFGFTTTFSIELSSAGTTNVAGDGFAFVIHNDPAGNAALGGGGSAMGYGFGLRPDSSFGCVNNGFAVEFDTFSFGPPSEFAAPHVAVHKMSGTCIDNNDVNTIANAPIPPSIDLFGGPLTVMVDYKPPVGVGPGVLSVYIENQFILSTPFDIRNIDGFDLLALDPDSAAYVGITAATGLADTRHRLIHWGFNDGTLQCEAPFWHVAGSGGCGVGCQAGADAQFIGSTPMTLAWFYNGVEITDDRGGRITGLGTDAISITPFLLEDFGYYKLVATNPCGSDFAEFFLNDSATCNDIDFNNDGVFPDNQDVIDLLVVFAGGSCPNPIAPCDPIDFNNDGVFPDNNDIVVFIEVFAGGSCDR
jgi:hypothetical protein